MKVLNSKPLDSTLPSLGVLNDTHETPALEQSGWQVARLLGEGGAAKVYQLIRPQTGELATLKVSIPGDEAAATCLATEDRVIRELAGIPGVPEVHPDSPAKIEDRLLLRFIPGMSLDKMRLSYCDVVMVACEVSRALAAAHERGFIHRDVKPANMILERKKLTLIDWGLGKHLSTAAAEEQLPECVGTPDYLPPEQIHGRAEPRSDIYALGCSLFTMFTGRRALVEKGLNSALAILLLHQERDGPNPRRWCWWMPRGLGELIERMMRRDPNQRPADARRLVQAFEWYGQSAWTRLFRGLRSEAAPSSH